MAYNNGAFGFAVSGWPVMAFPTAAMRAYAQNYGQGFAGPGVSAGGKTEFSASRLGMRRAVMLGNLHTIATAGNGFHKG